MGEPVAGANDEGVEGVAPVAGGAADRIRSPDGGTRCSGKSGSREDIDINLKTQHREERLLEDAAEALFGDLGHEVVVGREDNGVAVYRLGAELFDECIEAGGRDLPVCAVLKYLAEYLLKRFHISLSLNID